MVSLWQLGGDAIQGSQVLVHVAMVVAVALNTHQNKQLDKRMDRLEALLMERPAKLAAKTTTP
jgi:hypothetical protein